MSQMSQMRNYWDSLQPRERLILAMASLFIVIILLYLLLIEPALNERDKLEGRIANQQEDLLWMKDAATQLKGVSGRLGQKRVGGQSLLSYVDRSAKEHALGAAIKRIQPEGNKVRIRFEKVAFDRMTNWLAQIELAGYSIDGVVIERQADAGMVNARIVIGSST